MCCLATAKRKSTRLLSVFITTGHKLDTVCLVELLGAVIEDVSRTQTVLARNNASWLKHAHTHTRSDFMFSPPPSPPPHSAPVFPPSVHIWTSLSQFVYILHHPPLSVPLLLPSYLPVGSRSGWPEKLRKQHKSRKKEGWKDEAKSVFTSVVHPSSSCLHPSNTKQAYPTNPTPSLQATPLKPVAPITKNIHTK